MSHKPRAVRLHARTKEEFFEIVDAFSQRTGLKLAKISGLATGETTTLPRAKKNEEQRIFLDTVDKVLTFIENYGTG